VPHPDEHQISEANSGDALVVCIGNSLAGDDGAGQAVFDRLQKEKLPGDPELVMLGLGGMSLLEYLHGQPLLIVVDAVQLNGPIGQVHVLEAERIPAADSPAVSLHGIGLLETLSIVSTLYGELAPERTVLVGIEGRRFSELGAPLSREVAAAIDEAVARIKQLLIRYARVESET
jgi:hydrogenase maturation protease